MYTYVNEPSNDSYMEDIAHDFDRAYDDVKHDIRKYDFKMVVRKILSYAIEGLALSFAAYGIPKILGVQRSQAKGWKDVIVLGLVAAAVFALLDMYAPKIGGASRIGAGLAIGAYQIGGIPTQ